MVERHFFAACTKGLETAVASELEALEAREIDPRPGGVSFLGDRELGYRANLWLRSAIRIQEELLADYVVDADELYELIAELPWEEIIRPDQTLAVHASVRDAPELRHSGYAALRVKDAVVDRVREKRGARPSVDTKRPDLPLRLVVKGERVLLYRDTSGMSLHKRGWRTIQVRSPLNEATAAGLILLSDWDRASPVVDPMCGSGTFPVEAAMIAIDRAPGLERQFAFERFVDHDQALWERLRAEARERVRPTLDFSIEGADRHGGAIALAVKGAEAAGVSHLVHFTEADARHFVSRVSPSLAFVNPPYGERLGEDQDLIDSWVSLGAFLRSRCSGGTAWVLSGNKELTRHLGMRTSRRIPVMNGKIECRWLRYDVRPAVLIDNEAEPGDPSQRPPNQGTPDRGAPDESSPDHS